MSPLSIILFLATLSVLVVLHEYGHFIVARLCGVRVTDFALGMGPTLAKWTSPRSGTNYRLNAFPIGGYCQMKGEDGQSTEAEQQRKFRDGTTYDADNFQAKTPLQRLAIVLAGPIMNFVLALALLFGGAMLFGVPGPAASTTIAEVLPNLPAAKAGLRAGDTLVAVDGNAVSDGNALVALIHRSAGKPLHVEYARNGVRRAVDLTPVSMENPYTHKMEGRLGFQPLPPAQRVGPVDALRYTLDRFTFTVSSTLGAFGTLVTHPAAIAGQFRGPIGMAQASAQAQMFGAYIFVSFAALISISLGIFNLLPLPALDGGRGIFILVEMLRGKPVDPEKEALVHVGGFAVLIMLMIAVSYHDVVSMLSGRTAF